MHIAVRGPRAAQRLLRRQQPEYRGADVRRASVGAPAQQPVALFRGSLNARGDNAMDATPTLIWSTRRLVGKDFTALAVPRNRRSITANDTPIPTPRGPVVR
jgi:hypothetical protein